MSSDFVVLPPAKSGNSVRLKAKNVRELRMETLQLERHNQEMEQKLNQLRESMSREKEERERSNPYHWISGQSGNPRHDKENIGKVSAGKIRLKVLQNPISEPEKQKTMSRITSMPAPEKPKIKGKTCGQCENKNALLMCLECGEDYCTACFARFHQKGALKLHRTMPVQENSQDGKLDISHAFKKELNVDEASGKVVRDKEIIGGTNSTGVSKVYKMQQANGESFLSESRKEHLPKSRDSLLHGTFNEEESAKYFAEALLEWRNEAKNKSQPDSVLKVEADDTGSSEVQTVLTAITKPLHIEFKEDSLSYMEKLMLKKHRRTPVSQVPHNRLQEVRYSPTITENELDKCSDLTAEEMEAHENYVALFRAEEHVRNDVIHEPALKIVELDKDPEEKMDESRHLVMKETENNKRNNQNRLSPKSSKQVHGKQHNGPLRSTHCVKEDVIKSTCLKASHSQDSKSMKYKSFKDSRSLDTALMVNVPQELPSAVLRQPNQISEYQGLKGFFMLDIDPVEVKAECYRPQTADSTGVIEKVTYTGNNYWRPESSLSVCADDAVVQDIVTKAWEQCNSHITESSLTPRNYTHRGTASRNSYSSKLILRMSDYYSSPRPSSAAARPMSRAASEISEIESIDSMDREDYLFEDENERETLAILEKEFISLDTGNRKLQTSALNYDSFQLTRHGQRLAKPEDEVPVSRLPLHALQSCAVESESDEEETLQDKLNVLSLQ
ncbi:zinc finger B-box domain-containing protein 1 isoform X2 [Dendropsophus ebraccatus]|uniref:zinc finger B-box domain-containing protein 1 isoform X2 n=1 Tax=Dendropsophus ebraccatus TaxID=150705 RepID=UPI003832177D